MLINLYFIRIYYVSVYPYFKGYDQVPEFKGSRNAIEYLSIFDIYFISYMSIGSKRCPMNNECNIPRYLDCF